MTSVTRRSPREIRRLASLPSEPDRIEWVPTGQTYGEVWDGMTTAERRDDMLENRFRVVWHGDGKWTIWPGDMVFSVESEAPARIDATA